MAQLRGILAEHVAAVNAGDADAILGTFADDALVNDVQREFRGADSLHHWIQSDIISYQLRMEVTEVFEHFGMTVLRARYDGSFDRAALNLPADLILTNYVTVADDKITNMIIVHNNLDTSS